MKTIRVAMLIQRFRPTFTGHGIQIESLSRLLRARGADVEILTGRVDGAPAREDDDVPIRRLTLPATRNPLGLWWGARELLAYLGRRDPPFDILHLHGAPAGIPVILPPVHRSGVKTVITSTLLGSDDPGSLAARGRLARWRMRAYRSADRFIAICPALVATYPPAGIAAQRVDHIPIGVDVRRFTPPDDRDREAAALGWNPRNPRALFVGLVLHRKGVDVLLDAWARVLASIPDADLYIAGGYEFGPREDPALARFAERCRERAATAPLTGRVHFLGRQSGLERLYRAAHLFVFPSRVEGFPNVVLESLATATPPVVTRIPGSTDESVRDGRNGYVLEQEDAAGMAARIVELLKDEERRRQFGEAARRDAESRYALEIIAEAHLSLYRRLLAR